MLNTHDGWKLEAGSNLNKGSVHSRHFPGVGKVYKLQVKSLFTMILVTLDVRVYESDAVL